MNPMWQVLNKEVDLGKPTSFLDHENLVRTQRQCEISKDIVDSYRTMFESKIWPTSFLDHVYLACLFGLHSKRGSNKQGFMANFRSMFESRISAGAKEKLSTRASEKLGAETRSSWSYDMESHAKKCVERYCELANGTTQQLHKVATPCMDDHQFKEEENESVGDLSTICSRIVLKCLYLARIVLVEPV